MDQHPRHGFREFISLDKESYLDHEVKEMGELLARKSFSFTHNNKSGGTFIDWLSKFQHNALPSLTAWYVYLTIYAGYCTILVLRHPGSIAQGSPARSDLAKH